jgi:hypothetical protein
MKWWVKVLILVVFISSNKIVTEVAKIKQKPMRPKVEKVYGGDYYGKVK